MSSTIEELQNKIEVLEEENRILKQKLHTYTNPEAKKKYYEANKEKVKAKSKEYMKTVDPEKRKKWNRQAYLNKKKRLEETN
ncbi:MAG: hypothetical protein GTO02_12220 [Candidatus Dadabacteria bacterium]|nr:hypothetical protein [Candidatus Dadabacteria bacterium]